MAVVPFHTGPISHATGGPLSAQEAERVVRGQTIRCSGYQFHDGWAVCKGCFDAVGRDSFEVKQWHEKHGYRATLHGGAEYTGGLACGVCDFAIAP